MATHDKKMQVFISSTYEDMKDERQEAVMAVLKAGHIPAGMELFSANNKSQWETIKRWIEESDVFMLILGGRYGSIENESGRSYVELEYEYAKELNKPYFAVVVSDDGIDKKTSVRGRSVIEQNDSAKYNEFRKRVTEKHVAWYTDIKDIARETLQAIREFEKDENILGWIRPGDHIPDKAAVILREIMSKLELLVSDPPRKKGELFILHADDFDPETMEIVGEIPD